MPKMKRIYQVGPAGFNKCGFDTLTKAMAEVKTLSKNLAVGETVTIKIFEMTQAEWDAMPEHEGY